MAKKDKKPLEKKNWVQSFNIVGKAVLKEKTFRINERSEKSDWVYNMLNLGVDCGEKYGTVYCELMGGYGAERSNVVYVHGKKDDGTDDFENSYTIDWEDRFNKEVISEVGDLCFLTVGLEKDKGGKTVYNKFLTPYDAIAYINETLTDGAVVRVRGRINYTIYNDEIQAKKEINSIVLSNVEPDKFTASFTQTMLLTKDSIGKIDKKTNYLPITGILLEKFKEYNGIDLTNEKNKSGRIVPLRKVYEYEVNVAEKEKTQKIIEKLFKVKKDVTQITFEGEFVEGGALVTMTYDDFPEDIKELIDLGVMTEETAAEKCATGNGRERHMILRRPNIRMVGDDGNKKPQIMKTDQVYTEDDLIPDYLIKKETTTTDTDTSDDGEEYMQAADDDSWLDMLG